MFQVLGPIKVSDLYRMGAWNIPTDEITNWPTRGRLRILLFMTKPILPPTDVVFGRNSRVEIVGSRMMRSPYYLNHSHLHCSARRPYYKCFRLGIRLRLGPQCIPKILGALREQGLYFPSQSKVDQRNQNDFRGLGFLVA